MADLDYDLLVAASNHAIANGDPSADLPMTAGEAITTGATTGAGIALGATIGSAIAPGIGTVVGAAIGGLTGYDWRATATVAASGASQLYNSGISIANMLPGVEAQEQDTQAWITSMDDDLGKYYEQNKMAVDVGGFIATSIPAGIGALKAFNGAGAMLKAAGAGEIGANISNATGLLKGTQLKYLARAKAEMQSSGAAFDMLNKNMLASFAAGAGQNLVEGLVFETGAQIALNASPILSNQDTSDIFSNIAHAGFINMAVGGVAGAAIDSYKVVKALGDADKLTIGSRLQKGFAANTPLSEQIAENFNSRFAINVAELPEGTENIAELTAKMNKDAVHTVNAIDDVNRGITQQLVNGGNDAQLGNLFYETLNVVARDSGQDINALKQHLLGLKNVARPSTITKEEADVIAIQKQMNTKSNIEVTADANGVKQVKVTPTDYDALNAHTTSYVKLWGAERGTITSEAKGWQSIWDTTKQGEVIAVNNNRVLAGKQTYNFKLNEDYDVTKEVSVAAANARALWALKNTSVLSDGYKIAPNNIFMLEKAYKDMIAGHIDTISIKSGEKVKVGITTQEGVSSTIDNPADLLAFIADRKKEAAMTLLTRIANKDPSLAGVTEDGVASMLNVKQEFINGITKKGIPSTDLYGDTHAIQQHAKEWSASMEGIKVGSVKNHEDIVLMPQTAKLIYDTKIINNQEALAAPFTVYLKQMQSIYKDASARVVATNAGAGWFNQLNPLGDDFIFSVTRNPAGGTILKSADGNYSSAASKVEHIGSVVSRWKIESANNVTTAIDPFLIPLYGDTAAAAEMGAIMYKVRATPEEYILDTVNKAIVHKAYAQNLADTAAGKAAKAVTLKDTKAEMVIPIKNEKVFKAIEHHYNANAERLPKFQSVRNLNSGDKVRDTDVLYFPPPNLKNYDHYAFVTDPHVTGTGHVKMIWADSPENLEKILATVPDEFKPGIIKKPAGTTGPEVERWYEATGAYNRDDALTQNYFDGALAKEGTAAPYLIQTDGKLIAEQLKAWHIGQESNLIEETVGLHYAKEFKELDNLARGYSDINLSSTSTFRFGKKAVTSGDNPYLSYQRTMLARANLDKVPMRATQDWADKQVSKVYRAVNELWDVAKGEKATQAELDIINKTFSDAGLNIVNYDALTHALANHTVASGSLRTFAQRANSIIAGVGLGLDALNALNNRVGQMIMLAPEVKMLLGGIKSANKDAAGELAGLAHVQIPESEMSYLSTNKLISKALRDSLQKENREWGAANGYSIRHIQEAGEIVDTLALGLQSKQLNLDATIDLAYNATKKFLHKGAELTGNLHAEEMTRLTSALVMRDITDIAVKHGVIQAHEAPALINTFVNRTNGVYIASQRPMMFNGPIGQMIGLYQTYTMTLMNNMLRYAATGESKSAALMMGAQASIYGASGLPGFHAINSNLVGSFAGNTDHHDIYSVAYKAMDKGAADWLMFGALSNTLGLLHPDLKTNMYTRGDINPRNISIIPLNPADIPAVSISARFFSNLYGTYDKVSNGGSWGQSLLQGLEHNGISRPLTGIAQVLQGFTNPEHKSYSTTASGALIHANDLISTMNLARLAGAKPLDEARALDESYRHTVYKAKNEALKQNLGSAIKSKVIANQEPSSDEMNDFAREYVKLGGRQEGFNKYYARLMIEANSSVSNRMSKNLKDPSAQKMQSLMGGETDNDFMHGE